MASSFNDAIANVEIEEFLFMLFDSGYYDILFPFLIVYAIIYAVLSKVQLFQSKKTGKPISSVLTIISLVISWFGVTFEVSEGYSIGNFMMMLFPNISALTIGILMLYFVGSLVGKNYFKGVFDKKTSAFVTLAIGGIGLGAVVFYTGIVMGFWNYDPGDIPSYWNFIGALFLLILGIVFLIVELIPLGILFLVLFGVFVYNSGQDNILEYFVDPVVFMVIIILVLLSWLTSDKEKEEKLAHNLRKNEKLLRKYEGVSGKKPNDYESRIYDITDSSYQSNKRKWEELTGKNWK
jgi:hypothetical protein